MATLGDVLLSYTPGDALRATHGNRFEGGEQMAELSLDVFTADEAGFLVTSTLIAGERDAVLVDAQFTRSEARRLAEWVKASGKNLTTVYVTHDHPDHYFGLDTLAREFPSARLVTAPEVLSAIQATASAKVAQWTGSYGDEIPASPVLPGALDGDVIDLEGNPLRIIHLTQADSASASAVWIQALSAVVAGDAAFNGVHPWLAETDSRARKEWIANIDRLLPLVPNIVIAGHKAPGTDDAGRRVLIETRDYVWAFDNAVGRSAGPEALIKTLTDKFPNHKLPIILQFAADAAFARVA
jgi:glyoxylase-like metal-dependent hydrolase (beta-lactamase superfamily II)